MIESTLQPGGVPGWGVFGLIAAFVTVFAVACGVIVSRSASWILAALAADPPDGMTAGSPDGRGGMRWMLPTSTALAIVALFVWEVGMRGQVPPETIERAPWWPLVARFAAQGILGCLLIVATLVDLRYRVIPDAITVPGTLTGLCAVTLLPQVLLPVTCEIPRDYAPPMPVPDVLGAFGPLACGASAASWLRPCVSLACWLAWWSVCTASTPGVKPWRDGRIWMLVTGLALVSAVSFGGFTLGGDTLRAAGLEASLVGATVSGALVLATRASASRAVGREAMGMGDVTLLSMVGSWCGWQACVVSFFLAAFIGLAQGAWGWLRHRDNELPYGPSLSLASVLVILCWRGIWAAGRPFLEAPVEMAATLVAVVVLTGLALAVWARLRRF